MVKPFGRPLVRAEARRRGPARRGRRQRPPAVQPPHRVPGHAAGSAADQRAHRPPGRRRHAPRDCSDGLWLTSRRASSAPSFTPCRRAKRARCSSTGAPARRGTGDNLSLALVRIEPLAALTRRVAVAVNAPAPRLPGRRLGRHGQRCPRIGLARAFGVALLDLAAVRLGLQLLELVGAPGRASCSARWAASGTGSGVGGGPARRHRRRRVGSLALRAWLRDCAAASRACASRRSSWPRSHCGGPRHAQAAWLRRAPAAPGRGGAAWRSARADSTQDETTNCCAHSLTLRS